MTLPAMAGAIGRFGSLRGSGHAFISSKDVAPGRIVHSVFRRSVVPPSRGRYGTRSAAHRLRSSLSRRTNLLRTTVAGARPDRFPIGAVGGFRRYRGGKRLGGPIVAAGEGEDLQEFFNHFTSQLVQPVSKPVIGIRLSVIGKNRKPTTDYRIPAET